MAEWLLLKFSDNYADEFDVESLIVTTRDRWDRAKKALREAYPPGATFEGSFGTDEANTYEAEGYLKRFAEHPASLECARDLARAVGRSRPHHAWEDKKIVGLSWWFIIEHGVRPRVPDEPIEDWIAMLAFPAPPARCAAHGNVIGECDRGREGSPPWAPGCRREKIKVEHVRDPDYEALGIEEGS